MNKDIAFEQFTMFNFKPLTNNILAWENALSYSNELSNFIELVNSYSKSHNRISEWENDIKKIDKNNLKQSTGSNLLDKRTLYIINSLVMAFEMSFDRYCEQKKIDRDDYLINLNDIIIKKNNESNLINLSKEIVDNYQKYDFLIIAYINDNYEGGEILFPNYGIMLKPKAGSVLVVPIEELSNYSVQDNIKGISHVSYAIVKKKTKELNE